MALGLLRGVAWVSVLAHCSPVAVPLVSDKSSEIPSLHIRTLRIAVIGNGNPLWYPCLGNPMDRGVWWPLVHGVTKSWAWLSSEFQVIIVMLYGCGAD